MNVYPNTLVMTPAPTVNPPSRIAKREPCSNATGVINVILVGIVPLTLIIGYVAAGVLKRNRPEVYAGIGGVHPEDGHVPPAEPTDEAVESSVETAPQPGAAR